MSEDTRAIHETIDFGFEVEAFLKSKVGSYLIDRAEEEISTAVEKLKHVDPRNADEIQSLQNQVFRAESIQYWLAEVIQAGENAQRELIDRSD